MSDSIGLVRPRGKGREQAVGVIVRSADEVSPCPTIECGECGGTAALNLFEPVPQQVRAFLAEHRHTAGAGGELPGRAFGGR